MSIEIRSIGKRFGSFVALEDVNLHVPTGELVALLGPSGCGKTTLLRIIAGMESADCGQVLFAGEEATHLHARDRKVGFVFQHYALFRHMSVFENVAFGLRVKPRKLRPGEPEIRRRVAELLQLVQLDWLADRYPSQLSGGQRQRIALARAFMTEPHVLILDDSTSAIDSATEDKIQRAISNAARGRTTFIITHRLSQIRWADLIIVLKKGKIAAIGTHDELMKTSEAYSKIFRE